jgi:hypothetical protein
MTEVKRNLPAIQDLYGDIEKSSEQNALNILLNQPPKDDWLKPHPTAIKKVNGKSVPVVYLPIERIEYLLTKIFLKWRVEINDVKLIANSVVVTVRLYYQDPISGVWDWQDGVGATPLQTDKDAGATNFDRIKSNAVMIGTPAAESYAIKDAAEKIGKLFGKDMNRADQINYDNLIFDGEGNSINGKVTLEDIQVLFGLKKEALSETEIIDIERIIKNQEKTSYQKVYKILVSR